MNGIPTLPKQLKSFEIKNLNNLRTNKRSRAVHSNTILAEQIIFSQSHQDFICGCRY